MFFSEEELQAYLNDANINVHVESSEDNGIVYIFRTVLSICSLGEFL